MAQDYLQKLLLAQAIKGGDTDLLSFYDPATERRRELGRMLIEQSQAGGGTWGKIPLALLGPMLYGAGQRREQEMLQDVLIGKTSRQQNIIKKLQTGFVNAKTPEEQQQVILQAYFEDPEIMKGMGLDLGEASGIVNKLAGGSLEKIRAEKESRLQKQYKVSNVKAFGGSFTDEELQELGIDLQNYAKAGGAIPTIDKKGNRRWNIMPYNVFQKKVEANKFSPTEIEYFRDRIEENKAWQNVVSGLNELGIGESNLKQLGKIEFDMVRSPMGPVSIPARFNLAGQYMKDPKYTALKRNIELAFQKFRKRVTGAQASDRELRMLRVIIPSLKDRPEVFFSTINTIINDNLEGMKESLALYEAFGRDTTQIKSFLKERMEQSKKQQISAKQATGNALKAKAPTREEAIAELRRRRMSRGRK